MKISHILPLVVGSAACILSTVSPAQAIEFVTNGNFEASSTSLSGWTTNSGPFQWSVSKSSLGGNSTNYAVTTATLANPEALSQIISGLTVGNSYNFSFDYFQTSGTPNGITAKLGSTTLASLTNITPAAFTNFSTTFTASLSSATLTFTGYSNPGGVFIDNVSLTGSATPVPFDIPPGAMLSTIPILAFMYRWKQSRSRIALKITPNPVNEVVS